MFSIPIDLCLTRAASRKVFGKEVLPASMSEYIAIALLLVRERYVMGEKSFWWPYIQILPETDEVNPSFTWSDDELALLEGSPGIKATRSMQAKLRNEYASLQDGIFKAHPKVFTGVDSSGGAASAAAAGPNDGDGDKESKEPAGAFCFAHFEWAFTMLFSRAIRLDKLTGGPAVSLLRLSAYLISSIALR